MAHRLAPQAHADLEDIWLYLAQESGSETIADNHISALTRRFHLISEHPRVGRARDKDLGPGLRSFPSGNYIIVYDMSGDDVQILRVVHGRRNLIALFGGQDE